MESVGMHVPRTYILVSFLRILVSFFRGVERCKS